MSRGNRPGCRGVWGSGLRLGFAVGGLGFGFGVRVWGSAILTEVTASGLIPCGGNGDLGVPLISWLANMSRRETANTLSKLVIVVPPFRLSQTTIGSLHILFHPECHTPKTFPSFFLIRIIGVPPREPLFSVPYTVQTPSLNWAW